ncbi:MAG: hypothetical protein QOJ65_2141 [Fimbriimonadaceae bacterium]|jgi:ATP-dependent Clp protease adaptor protein ClpS|nr:hypothetical protein [Fimbriimonadaceae bacterium]
MSHPAFLPELQDAPPRTAGGWKVTIYNNDYTAQEDVFDALIRATQCDLQEAQIEIWEAEAYGKAPVHFAGRQECEMAAQIISGVGVKTEVTPEWDA